MVDQSNISTLSDNIKQGIENRLKDLHTSMPGIIVEFDAATQLAKVQPAVKRIFKQERTEQVLLVPTALPVLINVPVIFPRGGGFSLTFPVQPGDECLIEFCERCIDDWHETGEVKKPTSKRFHSLSDATCFVGLSSRPNKVPNYSAEDVQLKKDNGDVSITLKANNNLELSTIASMIATCETATINASSVASIIAPTINLIGNVNVNGNLTTTGVTSAPTVAATTSLKVGGKEMATHVHPQAPDSNGDTEQNTGAPL